MKEEVKKFFNENYQDGKIYNYKKIIGHAEYLISAFEKMSATEKIILYDLCFGEKRGKERGEKQSDMRRAIKISRVVLSNGEFTKSMITLVFLLRNFLRKSGRI